MRIQSLDPELNAQLSQLLVAARAGNVGAFEAFYAATVRLVMPVARFVCGDDHCEDALSDAYFQAWKQLPAWDPSRGSALVWIKMIARSRARDRMRAERVRNVGFCGPIAYDGPEAADPQPGPQEIMEQMQQRAVLRSAVRNLSSRHQHLLRLTYQGDLTQAEIAAQTGLPLGTVKTMLRRSYLQLRHAMAPQTA